MMNMLRVAGKRIVWACVCALLAQPGFARDKEERLLQQYLWNDVVTMSPEKRPRIGLVLGGGGARGLAHIGVLKVLEQERIPVDFVVGTSVGALIGALYCSGLKVPKIQKLGEEVGWDHLTNISSAALVKLLVAESLLSNEKLEQYLMQHIGNKQFSQLLIPFVCIATDLKTGERIIFREGSVIDAIRASSTVPGLFKPVEYRHRYLVDGGLVGNIPTDVAQLMGIDFIIAVDVEAEFTDYRHANVLQILQQSLYIQGKVISKEMLKKADFIIQPRVSNVSAIELWRSKECIDEGIKETRSIVTHLKKEIMDEIFAVMIDH